MIRAEFAKLLTVRGTYVAAAVALAFAAALAATDELRDLAVYPAAVAGFVTAHLLGEELASGAIANTLVVRPDRVRLIAAKALAAALLGGVLGVLAGAVMLVTWGEFDAGFIAAGATVGAAFALAGIAAAAATRRPGAASGVFGVVYLGLAGLLGETNGPWGDYGIGAAMRRLLDGEAAFAALTAAYALAFLSLGALVARRADL